MKIQIDHYTPTPAVSVIGCEGSFGHERLEIIFGNKWRNLKKHVTLYFSEDGSDTLTLEYKNAPILIPQKAYEKAGLCRYVVSGEGKKKRIVCKTGYLRVVSSPEESPLHSDTSLTKKRGTEV